MSAVLSACCGCGAVVTVPCPTLHDMDAAHAAIEAAGWRWDDREGHCCPAWPACSPVPAPVAVPPEPPQADLFTGAPS